MKKNILITTIIFIVATIMCYGYVIGHYSVDDYEITNIGYNEYSLSSNLKSGRPVMCLIDQLALLLNMEYKAFFIITVVLAILFTSIAITVFYNIIIKYFENKSTINKIILLLISYTIFFNFMYIENLYFVESIVMALALLLYLISANWLVNRKHIVWSVILATIATLCYNGFVCYYVTIVLMLSIFKNRKDYKSIIKDVIISGLIIVFSVIINFIQIKIVCNILDSVNNRLGNITNIPYNAKVIIKYLPQLFIESAGLFPKYLYLIFLALIYIITIIYTVVSKKCRLLIDVILISIVSIFSCFCISLVSLSAFTTGRILYGMGMTIGLLLLIVFYEFSLKEEKEKKTKLNICLIILVLIYFTVNVWNYMYLIDIHRKVNETEKNEVLELEKYIENYEKERNVKVRKIAYVVFSKNPAQNFYDFADRQTTVTSKAITCYYSCQGIINLYTGRKLEKINIPRYINNTKRIICVNDVLVCPIYNW